MRAGVLDGVPVHAGELPFPRPGTEETDRIFRAWQIRRFEGVFSAKKFTQGFPYRTANKRNLIHIFRTVLMKWRKESGNRL